MRPNGDITKNTYRAIIQTCIRPFKTRPIINTRFRRTFIHIKLTINTFKSIRTMTSIRFKSIFTSPIILTRIAKTIINFTVAKITFKSCVSTITSKTIDLIGTNSIILTWFRFTFVYINFTTEKWN